MNDNSQPAPVPVPAEPPLPEPALNWPAMLLLLNDYAMHVHDASEHQAESRADISKTAALKALERIRTAIAAHDSRWKALAHELIFAAAPAAPVAQRPVSWAQLGMRNGHTYVRMHYEGHLYPPPADVQRNLNLVPLYAAPQPQAPKE